jgi:hypothetical protein
MFSRVNLMVMEGVPSNDELARLETAVSATVAIGVSSGTDKEIRKSLSVQEPVWLNPFGPRRIVFTSWRAVAVLIPTRALMWGARRWRRPSA